MRRLANQSRNDSYSSKKDYQTLHTKRSIQIIPEGSGKHSLVLSRTVGVNTNTSYIAFGGFFYPSEALALELELSTDTTFIRQSVQLGNVWNRVGIIDDVSDTTVITIQLWWPAQATMNLWGITANAVTLPDEALSQQTSVDDLRPSHLVPETFYFTHNGAISLDIDPDLSSIFRMEEGESITLKKCAYCGRLLPVDMQRLGTLSFGKHNAKKTKHQNECRVCKKWHINSNFNPKRTTDQLHESSVITRERRIFLRDCEILQSIKQRTGAGLKSQVWERFGRKCFYCGRLLKLNEVQLDHTRPLAYLWPIDEHATCLCAEHNNQKKEKFPIDFYSEEQLKQLSQICGLSYEKLCEKKLNEVELQRILDDPVTFAQQWEPRTFAATARKIRELRPDVDLFYVLQMADDNIYAALMEKLKDRPSSIGDLDE